MRVSNGEVWQAKQALDALLKQPWPVKTAYRLAKLSQKLARRVATIDQVRTRLIQEYGEPDERGQVSVPQLLEIENENGKKQQVPNPRWAVFVPAFNELMAEDDEMKVQTVVLPTVGADGHPIHILPEILVPLLSFVEVEDEEDPPEAEQFEKDLLR